MNYGDSPVLLVYMPEDLSDESVHAISNFLNEISLTFDQMYVKALSTNANIEMNELWR